MSVRCAALSKTHPCDCGYVQAALFCCFANRQLPLDRHQFLWFVFVLHWANLGVALAGVLRCSPCCLAVTLLVDRESLNASSTAIPLPVARQLHGPSPSLTVGIIG